VSLTEDSSENTSKMLSEGSETKSKKSSIGLEIGAKEKLFLQEYAICFNIGKAAKKVGLSHNRASGVLRAPEGNAYLNELIKDYAESSILRKEFVELQWLETYEKLVGNKEVPMVDRDGCVVMAKKFHSAEVVSTLKELSKITGLSNASGEGNSGVTVNIDLSGFGLKNDGELINPHVAIGQCGPPGGDDEEYED